MKTIMARTPHETSFSFSRRYFNFTKKPEDDHQSYNDEEILTTQDDQIVSQKPNKKLTKLISALALFSKSKHRRLIPQTLGTKVTGTLFGYRRGHVVISFQEEPRSRPAFMIQISTPTSVLVREMASGLVRVALECDRKSEKKGVKLLEEPLWRAYCNGKKCGYATRRDAGEEDMKVLEAVGRVTMGAGVIPGGGGAAEGELMYMRAKFERLH
ncbi:hypothetical protein V2J09_005553 [Rumex salicifolius]